MVAGDCRLIKKRWVMCLYLAAALTAAIAGTARAECPPGYPENLPCPVSPVETVPQEHQDRVARLTRLGEGAQSFEFHTTMIGQGEHGQPDSNLDLGLRRAQAVAAALVRRGIYQANVYRVSFGELVPLSTNDTAAGRARNRRVEFLFGAQPQALVKLLERQEIELCAQKIDDKMDENCRIPITFDAQKVAVSPEYADEIASINRETKALMLEDRANPADIERKRQQIAVRRDRIPVVLDRARIEITLSPQRDAASKE
jgi:hypothetical protein